MSEACLAADRHLDSTAPMPARLRPSAPIAPDALLVGDPGRALMLAQELLVQPKMSNHARGLWGYTGVTHPGAELTIQSTGMGGPSAAVVLADLAELGVKRAIRLGTCASLGDLEPGDLLVVTEAQQFRGSLRTDSDRKEPRDAVRPDRALTNAIAEALPAAHRGPVVSLDALYRPERNLPSVLAEAADMQTAGLLSAAAEHGVAVAALLIVSEKSDSGQLQDEQLEEVAKRAGTAAAAQLSP
jgi:uridine phosphorylase